MGVYRLFNLDKVLEKYDWVAFDIGNMSPDAFVKEYEKKKYIMVEHSKVAFGKGNRVVDGTEDQRV